MAGVVVFPILLLLAAVLTQLAASGVMPKNRIAGIRIRSTVRSPSAWIAGHKAAAPWVWAGFMVSAVAVVAALPLSGVIAGLLAAIVILVFVATITASLIQAGRAARAASASEPRTA